ncbi:MAG TPA: hypothetical protein VEL76_36040 [Gemmataceae bacterium]|nr:hypothetical protein [Gemmataceae bacterium]
MNAYQEAILDALMVADKIGDYLKPGPLLLARDALRNAGLTQRDDPAAALGYPPMLCAAIGGASKTIRTVDDCRTLTISLFTEISPRSRAPKVSGIDQLDAVLWSLQRVPLLGELSHPLALEVVDLLEQVLERSHRGQQPATVLIEQLSAGLNREIERVEDPRPEFDPRRLALSAHYFALHALRQESTGDDPSGNAQNVVRDVARLAGLVKGLPAAIPYCVELARLLGL